MNFGGKYDAQNYYDEWHTTQFKLKLNDKTDKDIIEWLKKQKYKKGSSMQGAIKKLIRNQIAIETTINGTLPEAIKKDH